MPTFREQMLEYARTIAGMRYSSSVLVNGLQPLDDYLHPHSGEKQPGLRTKYMHELLDEFHDACWQWLSERTEHCRVEMLAEAAELLYYACQIDELQCTTDVLEDTLATLRGPISQILPEEAEAAALAKYKLKAARHNSKDHDAEHVAIMMALLPERC